MSNYLCTRSCLKIKICFSCKNLKFAFLNDCSLAFVSAQITKVWYSKAELSEDQWFQIDQKIVDLKVYSKLSQQGKQHCSDENTEACGLSL